MSRGNPNLAGDTYDKVDTFFTRWISSQHYNIVFGFIQRKSSARRFAILYRCDGNFSNCPLEIYHPSSGVSFTFFFFFAAWLVLEYCTWALGVEASGFSYQLGWDGSGFSWLSVCNGVWWMAVVFLVVIWLGFWLELCFYGGIPGRGVCWMVSLNCLNRTSILQRSFGLFGSCQSIDFMAEGILLLGCTRRVVSLFLTASSSIVHSNNHFKKL